MTVVGESLTPSPGYLASELIEKVRDFFRRPISVADLTGQETSVFTAEELTALRQLGCLELAGSLNRVYVEGEDETHLWRDRRNRVNVHFKRPDDFEEATRHTRMAVKYDNAGEAEIIHIRSALGDVALAGKHVIHLRVGRDPAPGPVLEEFDELRFRLQKLSDENTIAA